MSELERIASAVERIADLLDNFLVIPQIPEPPEQKLGKESISYLDEDQLIREEEEQFRLQNLGSIPTPRNG